MSQIVDNLIAFRIIKMLMTPFNQTDAFKRGVIDAQGKVIVPASSRTAEQKEAYTFLDRIIFKLKAMLNKLPGGESQLKNVLAALYLVREAQENKTLKINENRLTYIVSLLDQGVVLAEEQILMDRFLAHLQEEGEGGAPTNSVSGGKIAGTTPETGGPVIKLKDVLKYTKRNKKQLGLNPIAGVIRRGK